MKPTGPITNQQTRRAFSLIEVVIAVLVLALAVPPALNVLDSVGAGRADAINTTRSAMLATAVLETVVADINSDTPGLGFEALADADVYLNAPSSGLYSRLRPYLEPYTNAGMSYSVDIGPLVASDGNVSSNEGDNIFRVITVRVRFPSASTASYEVPISTMVSAL